MPTSNVQKIKIFYAIAPRKKFLRHLSYHSTSPRIIETMETNSKKIIAYLINKSPIMNLTCFLVMNKNNSKSIFQNGFSRCRIIIKTEKAQEVTQQKQFKISWQRNSLGMKKSKQHLVKHLDIKSSDIIKKLQLMHVWQRETHSSACQQEEERVSSSNSPPLFKKG